MIAFKLFLVIAFWVEFRVVNVVFLELPTSEHLRTRQKHFLPSRTFEFASFNRIW